MKKLPYWLKGGIVTVIIYILLTTIFWFVGNYLAESCGQGGGSGIAGCAIYLTPFILLTGPSWVLLDVIFGDGSYALMKETVILAGVFYFAVGVLIGYLYSHRKVKDKENKPYRLF